MTMATRQTDVIDKQAMRFLGLIADIITSPVSTHTKGTLKGYENKLKIVSTTERLINNNLCTLSRDLTLLNRRNNREF